ncbi:DUF736 family protein [Methylobacterium sp. J-043]|nr:DUF736 family protein [Methylobacterium sp. J-043]
MATIGTFTRTQNGFTGEIATLTIQAKRVTIVETTGDSENAPTHRIYLGKAEIGAGWAKRSQEQRDYEIRAMGETLERDPEVMAVLSPRRRELGLALTVQDRQRELARSRGQDLGLGF